MGRLERRGVRHRRSVVFGAAIFLAMLLFLRHQRGLLDATFWAEDGWIWYPEAYRTGLASLLQPQTGYLQTFSRLIALLSQPFPLLWAPTIFAGAAFIIRLVPPMLLLSPRFDMAWPSLTARLALSIIYVCIPNSYETLGNVTNCQWHLAIVGFLLVTAAPAATKLGRACDLVGLTVSGLRGPFCVLLLPIAGWEWNRTRSLDQAGRLVCVACCTAIQGFCLILTAAQTRSTVPLGASFIAFARIFAVQVELGLLLGLRVTSRLAGTALFQSVPLLVCLTVAGFAACAAAVWQGSPLFRKFALFGGLIFAASLASAVGDFNAVDGQAWTILGKPGLGQRYFLFPMLVLASAGMVLTSVRPPLLRGAGVCLCIGIVIGAVGDWPYPGARRTDFNSRARQFDRAPSGTEMAFPVSPPGAPPMTLVKQ